MTHEYAQKKDLNDECDRFYKFMKRIRSCGKKLESQAQVIVINAQDGYFNEEEWSGLIQTFKLFIKEAVVSKIDAQSEATQAELKDVKDSQTELKADVKNVETELKAGLKDVKADVKDLKETMSQMMTMMKESSRKD